MEGRGWRREVYLTIVERARRTIVKRPVRHWGLAAEIEERLYSRYIHMNMDINIYMYNTHNK